MQSSRTFRIFVSSTFSDLKAERNALQERVFPRLRDLAAAHGCRFQAIDLRWGVSEEAALDQQTMKICLGEIERCQKVTPRPNFIILLGNRYGWRPLSSEIPADEFKKILPLVTKEGKSLLEQWYRRDDNAVPAVYCLLPRTGKYVEYTTWERVENSLRQVFLTTIDKVSLSPDALLKYTASATEQEIVAGALKVQDANEHVFGFFREMKGLPQDSEDFGNTDAEAAQKQEGLKRRLKKRLPGNIHEYTARWQGDGPSLDHLDQLCENVYADLSKVILAEIGQMESVDPLDKEITAHDDFGKDRARIFIGRTDILKAITDYIDSNNPYPLVIWGPSGSGKSALMAKVVQQVRDSGNEVLCRFIRATPESSNGRSLLESLCRQISHRYNADESNISSEYNELVQEFPKRLALAKPKRALFIFLDALDQLSDANNARSLAWLPAELPPNVHLIVSTLPGECLDGLERRLPEENRLELRPMPLAEGEKLLDLWLKEADRTLQPEQRADVLIKYQHCGLPLYLRLAFEEVRRWRSYDDLPAGADGIPGLGEDISGILRDLFWRLTQESNHGRVLVERSLGYLAAAKNGLSEDEMLDVLSQDKGMMANFRRRSPMSPEVQQVPVVVWSRLYYDLEPYLAERSADGTSLMAFYHPTTFGPAVAEEYLAGEEKQGRHRELAQYFGEQALQLEGLPNLRKLSELPYQQTYGELWADLEQKTLCNIEFIEAKCATGMVYELLANYTDALAAWSSQDDPVALRAFARMITREVQHLAQHPDLAFPQAFYHMASSIVPELQNTLKRAQVTFESKGRTWLKTLLHPSGHAVSILAEHQDRVTHIVASPDGTIGVSASTDGWVMSFGLPSGKPLWQDRASVIVYDNSTLILDEDFKEKGFKKYARWARPAELIMAGRSRRVFLLATESTTISDRGDYTYHVLGYDALTGKQLCRVSVEAWRCADMPKPTPDGERVVVRMKDDSSPIRYADGEQKLFRVWDAGNDQELDNEAKRLTDLGGALLHFDGRFALSCQSNSIAVTDVRMDCVVGSWQVRGHPNSAAFSPDRSWFAVQTSEQSICVHNMPSGTEMAYLEAKRGQLGMWLISLDNRCLVALADGHLLTWEVTTGHLVSEIEVGAAEHFRLLAGGSLALVKQGPPEENLVFCDLQNGKELGSISSRLNGYRPSYYVEELGLHDCIALSTQERWLALMSVRQRVELWELESVTKTGKGDRSGERTEFMALTPNGRWLVTATNDGKILLRDFAVDDLNCRTLAKSKGTCALTISEDGEQVGWVTEDGHVTVKNPQTGRIIVKFSARVDNAEGCMFLSDGREMLIWGSEVRLWDLSRLKCRFVLRLGYPAYAPPLLLALEKIGNIEVYLVGLRMRIRSIDTEDPVSDWHFDPCSRLLVTIHERYRSDPRGPLYESIRENAGSRLWHISYPALALGWMRSSLVSVFREFSGLNLPGFTGESSREGPYCDRCLITKGGKKFVYQVHDGPERGLFVEPIHGWRARQVDLLAAILEGLGDISERRRYGASYLDAFLGVNPPQLDHLRERHHGGVLDWASRRLADSESRRLLHSEEAEDFTVSDDGKAVVFVKRTGWVGRNTLNGKDSVALFAAAPLVRCITDAKGLHVAVLDADDHLYVFALERRREP